MERGDARSEEIVKLETHSRNFKDIIKNNITESIENDIYTNRVNTAI